MPSVLIIEKQGKIRKSLVSIFNQGGFKTCVGTGWENAGNLLRNNVYDLIIVDLDLNPSHGYEMLQSIKFSQSDAEIIAIIPSHDYDGGRVTGCGAYDYIVKPIRQKDIVALGKKALEKKQLTDKVRNLEKIMDMDKSTLA